MTKKSMKNLFFKTLRNKKTRIALIAVLMFVSVLSAVLYVGTKHTVALSMNGKQQEIQTHADTVGDLLAEQNIQISNADLVTPSVSVVLAIVIDENYNQFLTA